MRRIPADRTSLLIHQRVQVERDRREHVVSHQVAVQLGQPLRIVRTSVESLLQRFERLLALVGGETLTCQNSQ